MRDFGKYIDLKIDEPHWITEYDKIYVLPSLIQNYAIVRLILAVNARVTVISQGHPIRHGKNCGGEVLLGCDKNIDLTAKFIWNGREWRISTYGRFLFSELEINAPRQSE